MNLPIKLALGFVGTAALAITSAVIYTQQETINRLEKKNNLLRETVDLLYRIGIRDESVIEDVHDHVIKYTTIPDDIRNL